MRSTIALVMAQLATAIAFVLLWQWLGDTGRIDQGFVGTPGQTWSRLSGWIRDGSLLHHVGSTMTVMLIGFLISTVLGTAIGVLMGVSRVVSDVLSPFLAFFNGMPRLVLQPLIIVALGFGLQAKVSLVVVVIVIMIIVSTASAFRDIDDSVVLNARMLGASNLDLALHVYLPSLALTLISSARTTLGFALQATLVSEFIGTADGLGFLIVKGQQTFDVSAIWAALVVVVMLAVALDLALSRGERYALRWNASSP